MVTTFRWHQSCEMPGCLEKIAGFVQLNWKNQQPPGRRLDPFLRNKGTPGRVAMGRCRVRVYGFQLLRTGWSPPPLLVLGPPFS